LTQLSLISAATLLILLITLIPLLRTEVWWVRGLDFPRLQFAFFAFALLIVQQYCLSLTLSSTWMLMAVTLGCLAYQLWWILPYTRLYPVEVLAADADVVNSSEASINTLTANVLTPNRNARGFLALVQQYSPDIVVTLESDEWWEGQLDSLQDSYPYSLKCPQDNLYGMHVYSRLPLLDATIEYLVEDDVPSMHADVELPSGQRIRAHFLHPAPPSPTENEESTERDAELIMVAKSLEGCRRPTIVTGDLNDVAWSDTTRLFRKISGLLDPRVGRGMFNTYHADHWFVRWPLDHLFHSDHFTVRELKRLPYFGSDHFALYASLQLQGKALDEQEPIQADEDDEAWADEKLAELNVDESDVPAPGQAL